MKQQLRYSLGLLARALISLAIDGSGQAATPATEAATQQPDIVIAGF